jgi:hypothetical protein
MEPSVSQNIRNSDVASYAKRKETSDTLVGKPKNSKMIASKASHSSLEAHSLQLAGQGRDFQFTVHIIMNLEILTDKEKIK